MSKHTTLDALYDALYMSGWDYDQRIADAVDAGDTVLAGAIIAEGIKRAKETQAAIDAADAAILARQASAPVAERIDPAFNAIFGAICPPVRP